MFKTECKTHQTEYLEQNQSNQKEGIVLVKRKKVAVKKEMFYFC